MIKKFQDFLKESHQEVNSINLMVKELINFVRDIDGRPYSECSRSSLDWEKIKPNILVHLKKDLNLSLEDVINLFIQEESNWNYFKNQVDQENANVDRFIYDVWIDIRDKNPEFVGVKPILGGDEYGKDWVNLSFMYDGVDQTEFMYKYLYGFHQTEYGQALIASQNVDLLDFIKKGNEYFDWTKFDDYLKSYLSYYNPVPKYISSEDGIKGLEFKVDINHWNNDYLIIDDTQVTFNYLYYMEDNGWLEYPEQLVQDIKIQLIQVIRSTFNLKSNCTDNDGVLFIDQIPKKIWHRARNPIKF